MKAIDKEYPVCKFSYGGYLTFLVVVLIPMSVLSLYLFFLKEEPGFILFIFGWLYFTFKSIQQLVIWKPRTIYLCNRGVSYIDDRGDRQTVSWADFNTVKKTMTGNLKLLTKDRKQRMFIQAPLLEKGNDLRVELLKRKASHKLTEKKSPVSAAEPKTDETPQNIKFPEVIKRNLRHYPVQLLFIVFGFVAFAWGLLEVKEVIYKVALGILPLCSMFAMHSVIKDPVKIILEEDHVLFVFWQKRRKIFYRDIKNIQFHETQATHNRSAREWVTINGGEISLEDFKMQADELYLRLKNLVDSAKKI